MSAKSQAEPLEVTSVYLADHCLQGEDVPGHVLWRGTAGVGVRIFVPDDLELTQLYNAAGRKGDGFSDGVLQISKFETPGYLGLLFKARKSEDPARIATVTFEITDPDGKVLRRTERRVVLFRPLVRVVHAPVGTTLTRVDRVRSKPTQPVAISNVGDGSAVIHVGASVDGKNIVGVPTGVAEFVSKYSRDVVTGLEDTKTEFPRYRQLLDRFVWFTKNPPNFDRRTQRLLRATWRMAQRAYEDDLRFLERVVTVVLGAYYRNLRFVTEVNSLLDYVNSIGTGRVVLSNAFDVVRVGVGTNQVSLELRVADAALKAYPPLSVGPITIVADRPAEIPIHCLFDWQIAKSGLELRLDA